MNPFVAASSPSSPGQAPVTHKIEATSTTKLLEIDKSKEPMPYPEAAEVAAKSAKADSEGFRRRADFRPAGTEIGDAANVP